ncbi:6-phosphogluconolactonase [Ichthyenterobacterium sp. W332]|uniref:6-phosphogluconolactonase n=1 Tax=Microcosmobacter mediterraneus TaxID=3075607 RepID=A0ABU2YJ41_9FLAO|nr:6-phosphogluconolactonase [Ichthyenterobacterium sp. W332]MDT0558057.1 6-phosphogluconolactonase [Ichthyenterobacterium sp. W332]
MKNNLQQLTTFSPDEFVHKSSKVLESIILDLLKEEKAINIALSGGSSPLPIYELLSTYKLDWKRISFYLVDERCVPLKSEQSNFNNIHNCFFKSLHSKYYSMVREDLTYEETAINYEKLIIKNLRSKNDLPQFDLIILGMGLDGHTASLFPGTDALGNKKDLVVLNKIPKLNTDRITMTFPLILNSKKIVLIASGEEKLNLLKNLCENNHPISKIIPQIYTILN